MGVNLTPDGLGGEDIIVLGGITEYRKSLYFNFASTLTWDVPITYVGATGGILEITAGASHYFTSSYGCYRKALAGYRSSSTNFTEWNVANNYTSTNGGSFSFSLVDGTTLRVTHTAGSYSSTGYGFIHVKMHT